jgi:5-methylcytosine-specific restriction endonuclease McrA
MAASPAVVAEARRQWRTRAGQQLAKRVVREEPLCWLQFPGICTRVSTTADHIRTLAERPDLVLDRANLHGACAECNNARRNTPLESLRLGADQPAALGIFE